MKPLATAFAVFLVTLAASEGRAQSGYPNNTVRIVVDSAAGSANDSTARVIGDALSKLWNQGVVTVNQPGAGGGISAKYASQQPADGYTLFMPSTSTFLALPGGPGVAPNLPVLIPRDFVAVAYILEQPLYIGGSHKSDLTTIADVIRAAKAKPGEVTYAATGRGRLTHLTMELLQARTGIKLQLVPYAGGPAQAMNDVMSGLVPLILDGYAGLAPAIKGNLIKGVAATSLKRLPGFESLPTVAETVPDFFVGAWTILLAPIGTPTPIIQKIHDDMQKVLDEPEMQAKLALNGGFVRHMTPDEVTAFVNKEQNTWRPIMEQVAKEAQK